MLVDTPTFDTVAALRRGLPHFQIADGELQFGLTLSRTGAQGVRLVDREFQLIEQPNRGVGIPPRPVQLSPAARQQIMTPLADSALPADLVALLAHQQASAPRRREVEVSQILGAVRYVLLDGHRRVVASRRGSWKHPYTARALLSTASAGSAIPTGTCPPSWNDGLLLLTEDLVREQELPWLPIRVPPADTPAPREKRARYAFRKLVRSIDRNSELGCQGELLWPEAVVELPPGALLCGEDPHLRRPSRLRIWRVREDGALVSLHEGTGSDRFHRVLTQLLEEYPCPLPQSPLIPGPAGPWRRHPDIPVRILDIGREGLAPGAAANPYRGPCYRCGDVVEATEGVLDTACGGRRPRHLGRCSPHVALRQPESADLRDE
ncbi:MULTISPECIES: hypothetical protein [unclassified Crossiella]|uniref:hypothetical protein n=1 Tax=unclassified Crossiella TaxID=2620835 RepID=UPI0020001219|nr:MULTISPECIES: hypothetical protein [unclassified Crossiella]MCK2245289.1 hypothetical protein [Crossiella sp. S99.2]MCK2258941.1 hypothetical protein [Crossiella sp. S99.1]